MTDGTTSALEWFQNENILSQITHNKIAVKSQVNQTWAKLGQLPLALLGEDKDYPRDYIKVVGEDSTRNRDILSTLIQLHAAERHMLVFCCNIAQADMLGQALILNQIPCGVIHHKLDRRDRRETILKFRAGELRLLLNVEVLTTGFDAPKVDTIVMCRPTFSRILYEQMIGRGMRGPAMGGTQTCEIVDFTDNFEAYREPQAWEAFWQEWGLKPGEQGVQEAHPGWEIHLAAPEDGDV